ncbi:MAG: quinolinate synthase NadA [Epulopiscium sp.]|nr:quinolinate synthase NadA [Candidatus Epulonipiscium sp.]
MNSDILKNSISKLKEEKDAIVLAHYYVDGDVQEIADFVGDSYYLSQKALESDNKIIVFCGVHFMAESAKILSPHKTVLMPDSSADCPMAHMVTPKEIKKAREDYDDLAVVCYINSTAQIKALSDVCVTSANAVNIVKNLKEENIFFIPDKNLGQYVASQVPDKNIFSNDGCCPVHNILTKNCINEAIASNPDALVLAHPECSFDILEMADFIGSTTSIIEYVSSSKHNSFIICTEVGILHQLNKEGKNKNFHLFNEQQVCQDMKKITLEKVYNSLVSLEPEIHVNNDISLKAKTALEMMHKLA